MPIARALVVMTLAILTMFLLVAISFGGLFLAIIAISWLIAWILSHASRAVQRFFPQLHSMASSPPSIRPINNYIGTKIDERYQRVVHATRSAFHSAAADLSGVDVNALESCIKQGLRYGNGRVLWRIALSIGVGFIAWISPFFSGFPHRGGNAFRRAMPKLAHYFSSPGQIGLSAVSLVVALFFCWAVFRMCSAILARLLMEFRTSGSSGDNSEPDRRSESIAFLYLGAAECAKVVSEWSGERNIATVPRMSISRIEPVILRSHQRHLVVRRYQRKEIRNHGARVVGALREIEARQDVVGSDAARDLMHALLKVADRYARGQILRLLDEDELTAPPVPRWEALKFSIIGVCAAVATLGLTALGAPEAVIGSAVFLVVGLVGARLYGWPRFGQSEILNMFKPSGDS